MHDTISRVVIGMDPHKRSATIEVMAADETVLGGGRFATDADGFAATARYVSRFPDHVWAIEGCNGSLMQNSSFVEEIAPGSSLTAE